MSTYTPNNLYVYSAAFTGAQSGLLGALFQEGSNPATYADSNAIVGAWAQAVDTVWADSGSPDSYQTSAIEELSKVQWIGRGTGPSPGNQNPTTYIVAASALIAIVTSGETYLAGQSIVPPAPPFPWVIVDDFTGVDPTGVKDSTTGIQAAYAALPASGGTMLFTDGSTYKVSNLVFTQIGKTVQLNLGRSNLNQSIGSTGPLLETNANIHITGQSENETRLNPAAGNTAIKLVTPWQNGGIGQYYGPSCIIENVGFFGGLHHIDSTGLLGFYEGNFHLQQCVFVQSTGLSVIVDNSVYYGFITECHWFQCQSGLSIGTATETQAHSQRICDGSSRKPVAHANRYCTRHARPRRILRLDRCGEPGRSNLCRK